MTHTHQLAAFGASLTFEQLPSAVVQTVKQIVLDSIGTTLAGGRIGEGCHELVATARSSGQAREARLLGLGERTSALSAALANGGMGHALNFDAIGKAGHLGSILAAPMAAAALRHGISGKQFIAAFAAGLEIMARSARPGKREASIDKLLEGQILGYFGAAVACGAVFGLTPERMHSALGLALMQAAGSMQVVLDGDPPAKAVYAAFSNHGGLLAALLARDGLDAQIAAFEGPAGLFAMQYGEAGDFEDLTYALGQTYELQRVAFKPWPCSGITHPFIEAAQVLGPFEPGSIRAIRLHGGSRTLHWFEPQAIRRRPATTTAAANSIFYTVACMLTNGELTLRDFSGEALERPMPFADIMTYEIDDALGTGALLLVETIDGGTHSKHIDAPLGTPLHPMSSEQLRRKFLQCAEFAVKPVSGHSIVALVERLEDVPDLEVLLTEL